MTKGTLADPGVIDVQAEAIDGRAMPYRSNTEVWRRQYRRSLLSQP